MRILTNFLSRSQQQQPLKYLTARPRTKSMRTTCSTVITRSNIVSLNISCNSARALVDVVCRIADALFVSSWRCKKQLLKFKSFKCRFYCFVIEYNVKVTSVARSMFAGWCINKVAHLTQFSLPAYFVIRLVCNQHGAVVCYSHIR